MAVLVECLFCKTMVGEKRFIRHVIEQHLKVKRVAVDPGGHILGVKFKKMRPVDARFWVCWCGVSLQGISEMKNHIQHNGGVHAHYLDCELGGYYEP